MERRGRRAVQITKLVIGGSVGKAHFSAGDLRPTLSRFFLKGLAPLRSSMA